MVCHSNRMMSLSLRYNARESSKQHNCRHVRLRKNDILADETVRRRIAKEGGDEGGYMVFVLDNNTDFRNDGRSHLKFF